MSLRSARALSLLATFGLLAACKSASPIGPPGRITLNYIGRSDSEYFFVLENRTAQDVSLPVVKSLWSGAKPWGSGLGCLNSDSSYESSIWPALDGSERRELVKVRSEERLSLKMDKDDLGTSRHSGPCTLAIWLESHEEIRSQEFKP
jgi:hypothetical protein